MTVIQARSRHKAEKSALATAQKKQKKDLDNVWKGELKTVLLARKEALNRLTTGSAWKTKPAVQKSAEKGAFTRSLRARSASYASNIANVKANMRAAKASLSANHRAARAAMSARHKSEIASFRK